MQFTAVDHTIFLLNAVEGGMGKEEITQEMEIKFLGLIKTMSFES